MGTYYHFTLNKNIQRILSEGLKPASETKNQNIYHGFQGDPHYSYLYSYEIARAHAKWAILGRQLHLTTHSHSLLKLEIDDQEVERDYDQILHLLYNREITDEVEKGVKEWAKGYGMFLQKVSIKDVKEAIDALPENLWRKKSGSYRTTKTITKIEVINWISLAPRIIQIIGYLTRPFYSLMFKMSKFK